MHHWNDAHEGHTEHCCFCIPTNVGAHIIGFLVTLSAFMNVFSAISAFALSPTAAIAPIVATLLVAYPAVYFLLMLKHNDENSRKHFASAYKVFAMIANVLIFLGALFVLALSIWGFIGTGYVPVLISGIVSVLMLTLAIFINVHYNRVVQTYAAHGHDHHHHEGYEKH